MLQKCDRGAVEPIEGPAGLGCGAAGPSLRDDESPASLYLPRRHTVTQAFYWIAAASKRDTSPWPLRFAQCCPVTQGTTQRWRMVYLLNGQRAGSPPTAQDVDRFHSSSQEPIKFKDPDASSRLGVFLHRAAGTVWEPSKKRRHQTQQSHRSLRSPTHDFPRG